MKAHPRPLPRGGELGVHNKKRIMKNWIIAVMMLLIGGTTASAQTIDDKLAAKMDSMAVALFRQGN